MSGFSTMLVSSVVFLRAVLVILSVLSLSLSLPKGMKTGEQSGRENGGGGKTAPACAGQTFFSRNRRHAVLVVLLISRAEVLCAAQCQSARHDPSRHDTTQTTP